MKQPNPDNMRHMLDLLCEATDETLEDSARLAIAVVQWRRDHHLTHTWRPTP